VNGGFGPLTGRCSGGRGHAFYDSNAPDSASKATCAD
jgi:hypothetical protein